MVTINKDLRRRILEVGKVKRFGHYGSIMSCLDVIKYLYDEVLTKDDIFILSKGHGAPALHAVLESKGMKAPWTVHNIYDEANGIKATTGSLGLGLPTAIGRAFAKRLKGEPGNVYCMVGDGECQEGVVWESLNIAHRFRLTNFILLVDYNKYQAIQDVETIMDETNVSLRNKLTAFGMDDVVEIDGHDVEDMEYIKKHINKNCCMSFLLHTQKGKGIPFLEKNPSWHVVYQDSHPEIFTEAMEALKE
jgi:transketolase